MYRLREPARAVSEEETPAEESAPPASFEAFFESGHGRLLRALFLVTGNAQEAEEIVQDAFVAVWERWDRVGTIERKWMGCTERQIPGQRIF
jgi:DNA-directed RNA polymerase specialized sigma24 family protein